MTEWLVPSTRTLRWVPLGSAAAGAAAVWAITSTQGQALPTQVAVLACGAVASALPLALDDPAHALLAASPTTERRRLLRRLGVAMVPVLLLWLALGAAAELLYVDASRRPSTGALVALGLAGVAAVALTNRHRPAAAAAVGGALPLTWVASSWYLPDVLDELTTLWLDRSGAVALLAGAVVAIAARS